MKNRIFGTSFWLQCPGQKYGRNMVLFDSLKKETEFKSICPPSAEPVNFAYHPTSLSRVVVKPSNIHLLQIKNKPLQGMAPTECLPSA